MRLCVFVEPQLGATYDDQLRIARHTEECGFEGFFRSDHYLTMGSRDGLPGPTDAWVTLGALARKTSRVRLGTLVSSATFRLPGPLSIIVAQVDAMSGGRVELGLGTGWYEAEHTAYGIPFPPLAERFDRLAEQLEIITGLWSAPVGSTYSFEGTHYRLTDSPALPKPVQSPRPPVIVGGGGSRRTPALAARYADEYNSPFATVEVAGQRFDRVRRACEEIGRDPASLTYSVAVTVCCGRTDAEVRARAERLGRDPQTLRERGAVVGTPGEVAEQFAAYGKIGATRIFMQILDMADLDHLDVLAAEVAPAV
ncbi:MAG TPA: LLM class F420-dependent oxidoreductase [Natronosporangium sp.]|nr:LLM class F420-dependent oxidoreductase [Natronosporangium sp.]